MSNTTVEVAPLPQAEEVLLPPVEAKEDISKGSKPKKTAPKKKARDISELIELATKGMTDKEKENLITYLKSEMHLMENKITALQNNCEQAYAKARRCEEEYAAMERFYKERLSYIDQQLTAFGNAVRLSIVGGLN